MTSFGSLHVCVQVNTHGAMSIIFHSQSVMDKVRESNESEMSCCVIQN